MERLLNLSLVSIFALVACLGSSWQFCYAANKGPNLRPANNLRGIAYATMEYHFMDPTKRKLGLNQFVDTLPLSEYLKTSGAVFVTLSSDGKTRACWGEVYPQHKNLLEETVYATLGALTKEYRFRPVKPNEWQKLKIQVSVIKGVEPVSSSRQVNPLRDGMLVRSGARAGVILPGEAVDSYYQMILCKLKAGIASGAPCQIYRLRTEIHG